jgi:phospholipase/carboxylesterase
VLPVHHPQGGQPPLDLAGIAATFVLLACFVLGITRLADPFLGAAFWPAFLAAAAVMLGVLVSIERRAAQPVIPLSLFGNRQLAITYGLAVGAGFGMGAVIFLTSIATFAYGIVAKQAGFVLLPLVIFSMLGSVGAGRLLNRLGPRGLIAVGFAMLALGYGATAITGHGLIAFYLASVPVGLGVGIVVGGALRSIAIDEAPAAVRGAAQGLINICTAIGTLLAAAAISAVADFGGGRTAGFALAYEAAAVLMVSMLLLTLVLRRDRRRAQRESIGPLIADASYPLSFRRREPPPERPQSLLVLLHGLRGNERDLAALAAAVEPGTLVVLPRGPLIMGKEQFGWFDVKFTDRGSRIDAAQANESRMVLIRFVERLQAEYGIAARDTVIAGFSQGGIESASVALSAPERVAGFGILSGRILPELEPHLAAQERLRELRAFVGHGREDATLPVACAQRSGERLDALGIRHTTRLYPVGHSVSAEMVADFGQWLQAR